MQSLSPKLARQVEVLVPVAIGDSFDYSVPEEINVVVGSYVLVPFGSKTLVGVVIGASNGTLDAKKYKSILEVFSHIPPASTAFLSFITICAQYYMSPRNQVFKMVLSQPEALTKPYRETRYNLSVLSKDPEHPAFMKRNSARNRILNYLSDKHDTILAEILENTSTSKSVVTAMVEAKLLDKRIFTTAPSAPIFDFNKPTLSKEQKEAASLFVEAVNENLRFQTFLLEGVTGSGKTEVYFEAIEAALLQGKQSLILLPEIALSVQWTSRFKQRFGFDPTVWHSAISESAKRTLWQAASCGTAPVIVGARSALFIPCKNLGLIIVDEEHETSYKQEDHVMYHARDMAIVRAYQENIPIILASASPSLESLYNVEQGKYQHVRIHARFAQATLPHISLIDMKKSGLPSHKWLSPPLIQKLHETIADKKQAILFLNRKGYAPLLLCRHCGYRFACPSCTSWLVLHKSQRSLCCHHCGYATSEPKDCPQCHQTDALAACGPGTERIYEETLQTFPNARITTITSDHLINKASFEREIERIQNGEVDIIIGTQILAKGHHFSNLTLVGILDADLGLSGGDLRCVERSWQLLHQISGRAGREEHQGHVYIQTWQPEHPLMQALAHGKEQELIALEKEARSNMLMPPYGRLASIILESQKEELVQKAAQILAQSIPSIEQVTILGPAPAPLYRLRNHYRIRFLVKTPRNINIQRIIANWLHNIKLSSMVRCKIDIDPYSFL